MKTLEVSQITSVHMALFSTFKLVTIQNQWQREMKINSSSATFECASRLKYSCEEMCIYWNWMLHLNTTYTTAHYFTTNNVKTSVIWLCRFTLSEATFRPRGGTVPEPAGTAPKWKAPKCHLFQTWLRPKVVSHTEFPTHIIFYEQ